VNLVNAGSAIPVKFSLGGNRGLAIFAAGYPRVTTIACTSGVATDEIETTVTASGSGLQYDPTTGLYTYTWKTTKNWSGCRRLELLFVDGSLRVADFRFK
jgi:hypothetical protein